MDEGAGSLGLDRRVILITGAGRGLGRAYAEALAGQGIGLGFGGILDELMNQGRLVKPLDLSFTRGRAVYMTLPKGAPRRPEVESFVTWVKHQAEPRQREADRVAGVAQAGR